MGNKGKQIMTAQRKALLEDIIREQTWANAHQTIYDLEGGKLASNAQFHITHRDMAVHARDELLAKAPEIVRTQFFNHLMEPRTDPLAYTNLNDVEALLASTRRDLNEILESRKRSWRNYRSRPAHAFVSIWKVEIYRLEQRRAYLLQNTQSQ